MALPSTLALASNGVSMPSALSAPKAASGLKIRIKLGGMTLPAAEAKDRTDPDAEEIHTAPFPDSELQPGPAPSKPKSKRPAPKSKSASARKSTKASGSKKRKIEEPAVDVDLDQDLSDLSFWDANGLKRPRGRPKRLEALSGANSTGTPEAEEERPTSTSTTGPSSNSGTRLVGYRMGGRAYNPVTDWREQPVVVPAKQHLQSMPRKWEQQYVQVSTSTGELYIRTWKPVGTLKHPSADILISPKQYAPNPALFPDDDDNMGDESEEMKGRADDKRLYVCDHPGCIRAFGDHSGLSRHITVSHGPKRFVCEVPNCLRRFNDASKLKRHMGAHERNSTRVSV